MRAGYEPLAGRRRAVTLTFGALIVVNLVAIVLSIADLNLLDRLESGELVGDDEIDAHDNRVAAAGGLQALAYLGCAIVFIRWLRAAYRNVDLLSPGVRRYGHGWAIGAWFVPILNLWRPKQIVNDVWRGSGTPTDYGRPPVLLLVWWLSYLAGEILGRLAFDSAFQGDTIEELRTADFWYIVSDLWDVANALMAVSVVRYLTRRLDHRATVLAERAAEEEATAADECAAGTHAAAAEAPSAPERAADSDAVGTREPDAVEPAAPAREPTAAPD